MYTEINQQLAKYRAVCKFFEVSMVFYEKSEVKCYKNRLHQRQLFARTCEINRL